MTFSDSSNVYDFLGVAPDAPQETVLAALERAARQTPAAPEVMLGKDVLQDRLTRAYFNAECGYPPPTGSPPVNTGSSIVAVPPGRSVAVPPGESVKALGEPQPDYDEGASPIRRLMNVKWPLRMSLATGISLSIPFPFVDICRPELVGGLEPEWVPAFLIQQARQHEVRNELLALLYPLRSDSQQPDTPKVWIKFFTIEGAATFDELRNRFLTEQMATKMASEPRTRSLNNSAQAREYIYEREYKNEYCGLIEVVNRRISAATAFVGQENIRTVLPTLGQFTTTDSRYRYAIDEIFWSLTAQSEKVR